MVWAEISLSGHTDLHVFQGGTLTGVRYRDEILDPYVCPYDGAIGNDFILMDGNARTHRAVAALSYPTRSSEVLEQSFLRVWFSLPISVIGNLIDSIEIRCRQHIQARARKTTVRLLNVSRQTVSDAICSFKELGKDDRRPGSGHKCTVKTSRNHKAIEKRVQRNPSVPRDRSLVTWE
ncbi:uncharacterized protein TNCV_3210731 [Trichonephila clavipes]|nr:uncharacterized protein TNCV_3210731 [Trichonephila clavipes]